MITPEGNEPGVDGATIILNRRWVRRILGGVLVLALLLLGISDIRGRVVEGQVQEVVHQVCVNGNILRAALRDIIQLDYAQRAPEGRRLSRLLLDQLSVTIACEDV